MWKIDILWKLTSAILCCNCPDQSSWRERLRRHILSRQVPTFFVRSISSSPLKPKLGHAEQIGRVQRGKRAWTQVVPPSRAHWDWDCAKVILFIDVHGTVRLLLGTVILSLQCSIVHYSLFYYNSLSKRIYFLASWKIQKRQQCHLAAAVLILNCVTSQLRFAQLALGTNSSGTEPMRQSCLELTPLQHPHHKLEQQRGS